MLLSVRILLEALYAEDSENAILGDEGQIDHRGRRLRFCTVRQDASSVDVLRDVLRSLACDIVDQDWLSVVDAPHGQLILIACAARIGRIAFTVFDGEAVFNEVLLRMVQANAEDAGICDAIHMFIEFEENGIQVE